MSTQGQDLAHLAVSHCRRPHPPQHRSPPPLAQCCALQAASHRVRGSLSEKHLMPGQLSLQQLHFFSPSLPWAAVDAGCVMQGQCRITRQHLTPSMLVSVAAQFLVIGTAGPPLAEIAWQQSFLLVPAAAHSLVVVASGGALLRQRALVLHSCSCANSTRSKWPLGYRPWYPAGGPGSFVG